MFVRACQKRMHVVGLLSLVLLAALFVSSMLGRQQAVTSFWAVTGTR